MTLFGNISEEPDALSAINKFPALYGVSLGASCGDWSRCRCEQVPLPRTILREPMEHLPTGRAGMREMELRRILSDEIKKRGGPVSYQEMLANEWMEIDSELPPELSAALAAMKRVDARWPEDRE